MNNIELLPQWFIIFYVILIGLCCGSFLNVVILRGLSGESLVFSRSKCPKCNSQLTWYMNIPLISYIFLKGKCAYCKEHISIQYPIIESLCAILFCITYLTFGLTFKTLFLWVFLALFIAIATTDILKTVIIDIHTYILAIIGFIFNLFNFGYTEIQNSIIGAISGFLIMEFLAFLGTLFLKHRAFGEGDSLIVMGLGAIFGFKNLLIIIPLSIIIQAIFSLPVLAFEEFKNKNIKLCLSYIFVFMSLFIVGFLNLNSFNDNTKIYLSITIPLCIILLWSLKIILKDLKYKKITAQNSSETEKSVFKLLPFGPALILSATILFFYLDKIKELILNFIY